MPVPYTDLHKFYRQAKTYSTSWSHEGNYGILRDFEILRDFYVFQDFKACYFKSQSQGNVILADSEFRRIYYYTFILYIWLHFRHEGSCTPHMYNRNSQTKYYGR